MEDEFRVFTVSGQKIAISRAMVEASVRDVVPESIQTHAVSVSGADYPVKQVFALATGLDRLDFTSATARRNLQKLGFSVTRSA